MPEEVVGEMLTDLWGRRDRLEGLLADAGWDGNRMHVSRELADVEEALGLREEGAPLTTGDSLSDYLLARTMAGTITPEDLDLTPEKFAERQR